MGSELRGRGGGSQRASRVVFLADFPLPENAKVKFSLGSALAIGWKIRIIQIICSSASERSMAQTTAMEFQRKFGEFQHQAQREPVEITRHGRRELVLMSADHYDWLVAAARRTHRTTNAASVVADAVRRAEMDPEHSGLDNLLK
jgi:prevent-host-death family protein